MRAVTILLTMMLSFSPYLLADDNEGKKQGKQERWQQAAVLGTVGVLAIFGGHQLLKRINPPKKKTTLSATGRTQEQYEEVASIVKPIEDNPQKQVRQETVSDNQVSSSKPKQPSNDNSKDVVEKVDDKVRSDDKEVQEVQEVVEKGDNSDELVLSFSAEIPTDEGNLLVTAETLSKHFDDEQVKKIIAWHASREYDRYLDLSGFVLHLAKTTNDDIDIALRAVKFATEHSIKLDKDHLGEMLVKAVAQGYTDAATKLVQLVGKGGIKIKLPHIYKPFKQAELLAINEGDFSDLRALIKMTIEHDVATYNKYLEWGKIAAGLDKPGRFDTIDASDYAKLFQVVREEYAQMPKSDHVAGVTQLRKDFSPILDATTDEEASNTLFYQMLHPFSVLAEHFDIREVTNYSQVFGQAAERRYFTTVSEMAKMLEPYDAKINREDFIKALDMYAAKL